MSRNASILAKNTSMLDGGLKSLYLLAAMICGAAVWAYLTPLDISIRSRGIVRPEGEPIRIIAEVGGRIRKIFVNEGDHVARQDPLLEFDIRDLVLKKRAIDSRIRFAQSRLKDVERQIDDTIAIANQADSADSLDYEAAQRSSDLNVQSARERFDRTTLLFQDGLVSKQMYDESRFALAQAEADRLRLSSRSMELKRAQSALQIRKVMADATPIRNELAVLYNEREQTDFEIERRTIRSPADGRITSLAALHADETIAAGTIVAALVANSHVLVIESWVPNSDRFDLAPGQRVRLRSEAFPPDENKTFGGVIQYISPDARFNESLSGTYRVLIRPADNVPPLSLGTTFEVNFITRQERLIWILFEKIRHGFR
jgi:multidrug resistance efflux pump